MTLESELVSGFMTEHAAVIFVFFFLAEYASIVLICILTSLLFLGGYMYDYEFLANLAQYIDFDYYLDIIYNNYILYYNPLFEGLAYGLSLGLKTSIMIFIFIWVRASFPRIRFDQLMSFCWTVLLPIVIALIIIVPCILDSFEILPADISLLSGPFMVKNNIYNKDTIYKINFKNMIVGLVTVFVLFILYINFIRYANCYFDNHSMICMMKDSENIASGVLEAEANNVRVNNVDAAVAHLRDGAVYIGGMTAAAKVVRNSSLPIGAKLGAVMAVGGLSLIGYRSVSNNLSKDRTHSSMNIEIEKINSSIGLSKNPNNGKTDINKFLPDSSASLQDSNGVSDISNISPLDLEQLQLEFYSHILIIYLLIIVFVFLLMKSLSSMNFKFEFLNNIPFLKRLLLKVMHWWGKTSIIWVYMIIISILISIIISTWSIYIILNNVSDISNISSFDLEQLQLEFYLHIAIAYLLIVVLVFLLSKSYNSMNFKFKFLNNVPFLQRLFVKLMHWLGIPSTIQLYVMLINILICMIMSAWDIYTIINNISLSTDISLLFVPFMVKKDIFNKINKRFYSSYRPKTRTLGQSLIVVLALILHGLLVSPPKPHAFVSIQLNSGLSFNWSLFKTKLKEKCTIWNGLILFIPPLLGYSLKVYVISKWGVELNDLYLYVSTYGVIGGFVQTVKIAFEVVKDSYIFKMEAAGGNIPTQPGAGPAGPAGPAPEPQAMDVNENSTRRDNGTRTTGFTDQNWDIDRNHVFPDYHQAVDRGHHGKILANILEYDCRVNKRTAINSRTQINYSARAFLYNHFHYYRNPNPLNYGASIPNNFSLRDSLRNLR